MGGLRHPRKSIPRIPGMASRAEKVSFIQHLDAAPDPQTAVLAAFESKVSPPRMRTSHPAGPQRPGGSESELKTLDRYPMSSTRQPSSATLLARPSSRRSGLRSGPLDMGGSPGRGLRRISRLENLSSHSRDHQTCSACRNLRDSAPLTGSRVHRRQSPRFPDLQPSQAEQCH